LSDESAARTSSWSGRCARFGGDLVGALFLALPCALFSAGFLAAFSTFFLGFFFVVL